MITAAEALELIEQRIQFLPDTVEEARLAYEDIGEIIKSVLGPAGDLKPPTVAEVLLGDDNTDPYKVWAEASAEAWRHWNEECAKNYATLSRIAASMLDLQQGSADEGSLGA